MPNMWKRVFHLI